MGLESSDQERAPLELSGQFVGDLEQRLNGLRWRQQALNETRSDRSEKSGAPEKFTSEEQAEYDALGASRTTVRDFFRQAADIAQVQGEYGTLQTDHPIGIDRLEGRHPRKLREMAELYRLANQELQKYPKYRVDGVE